MTYLASSHDPRNSEIHEEDTPKLRQDLSDAAAFLLPIAQAHVKMGDWPIEVSAWLMMVRDSLCQKPGAH